MRLIQIALFVLCSATLTSAQDATGSQDHPLISRFPNTTISSYFQSDFERFSVATGPITQDIRDEQGRAALPPIAQFEGKVTSITYVSNDRTDAPFAIFRNYESALAEAGFEVGYQCEGDAGCGPRFVTQLYYNGDPQRQGRHRGLDAPNVRGSKHTYFYWNGESTIGETRYIVSLLVVQHTNGNFPTRVVLDVNEVDVLAEDQVLVTTEELSSKLEANGRVVLEGVYFAFDSANLDPRSEAAISNIAALMTLNPENKYYVVGHTDSTGSIDYNQSLSLDRAQSVVLALTEVHGIEQVRMVPFGIGPVSPISTNRNETGRALNRRVELVLRAE